jgi:hypothetical protein
VYAGDTSTADWRRLDDDLDLSLQEGVPYFISVRCQNAVGLETVVTPGSVVCDISAPLVVRVSDGSQGLHRDSEYWGDKMSVSFSFEYVEYESEVVKAFAALSTRQCGMYEPEDLSWNLLGHLDGIASIFPQEALPEGRYYTLVKVQNILGRNSSCQSSGGFQLVSSRPVCHGVWNSRDLTNVLYSSNRYMIAVSWNCSAMVMFDAFEYNVFKIESTGEAVHLQSRVSGDLSTALSSTVLESGVYQIGLTAFDQLGRHSEPIRSTSFIIDLSAPLVKEVIIQNPDDSQRSDNTYRFTNNTSAVAFSFSSSDEESGILSCMWRLERYLSMGAVTSFAAVGSGHSKHAVDPLEDDEYHVRVTCKNNAGLRQETVSPHFVVDTSGPFCGDPELQLKLPDRFDKQEGYPHKVDAATYTCTLSTRPEDLESGLEHILFILSKKMDDGSWRDIGKPGTQLPQNLTLHNGTEYACAVVCQNRAGVVSQSARSPSSPVILGDIVPGKVRDGWSSGTDLDFQTHESSVFFTFEPFLDPTQSPLLYYFAAGTSKNSDDIMQWRQASPADILHRAGYFYLYDIALPGYGQPCFIHVRATSMNGLRSANASSDGVVLVTENPTINWVGLDFDQEAVVKWEIQKTTMPTDVFVKFGTFPGGSDLQTWLNTNESVDFASNEARISSLTADKIGGRRVWVALKVVNEQLGIETIRNNISTGKMFDITAPELPRVSPYLVLDASLRAVWGPFVDDESSIVRLDVCLDCMEIGSLSLLKQSCVALDPSVLMYNFPLMEQKNVSAVLQVRVTAVNEAGLSSLVSSLPVVIDASAPDCPLGRPVAAVETYRTNPNDTVNDTVVSVSWAPCHDNESAVTYTVAVEMQDQTMLYARDIRSTSHALDLGTVPNAARLAVVVTASSSGGTT